jgi:hypothetical protein
MNKKLIKPVIIKSEYFNNYDDNALYLAIRNDNQNGTGTFFDPYNANTQELFDSYLSNAAAGKTIYLSHGTFETQGYQQRTVNGSYVKLRWKVIGQGIDKTIIKLVKAKAYGGPHWCFGTNYDQFAHNTTWKNFTLDCNLDGQIDKTGICIGGMSLGGNHILYDNIKVINWGTRLPGAECFVLSAGGTDLINRSNLTGATIQNCIVTNPASNINNETSSLIFCGGAEDYVNDLSGAHINPVIKNCYCDGGGPLTSTNGVMAIGKNCLIENNIIKNVGSAFYTDTTRLASITVKNNQFINVQRGIQFNLYDTTSTLGTGYFLNNLIELASDIKVGDENAFRFLGNNAEINPPPPYTFSYIMISGNKIGYYNNYSQSQTPMYVAAFYNTDTAILIDNVSSLYQDNDPRFNQQVIIAGHVRLLMSENNKSLLTNTLILENSIQTQ